MQIAMREQPVRSRAGGAGGQSSMQSNIIDFPKSKQPDATGVLQEAARSLVANFSAASAAALSSSIDHLAKAVDKVAILVDWVRVVRN